jgi:hypothetical protein
MITLILQLYLELFEYCDIINIKFDISYLQLMLCYPIFSFNNVKLFERDNMEAFFTNLYIY